MTCKIQRRTIDGLDIETMQLWPNKGFLLTARLAGLLGPAMAELEGLDFASGDVMPALGALFARLSPEDADGIKDELLARTSVIHKGERIELNQPATIDLMFDGNLKALFKTLAFSLEVNFADFFDFAALAKGLGQVSAKVAESAST